MTATVFDTKTGASPVAIADLPQRLAAGEETVVAIRRRKGRQEGEGLPAAVAKATANPDPIVLFIMCLFAAAAMADDRVLTTNRAAAQDEFRARLGPIGCEVVRRGRKWINRIVTDDEGSAERPSARMETRGTAFASPIRISTGKE